MGDTGGTSGAGGQGSRPSPLTLVDLGPIAPIESAARAWRDAIGIGVERGLAAAAPTEDRALEAGLELRRRVLDPVLAATGNAGRVVLVLDDVLHLVPLDALPDDPRPDSRSTAGPRVLDRLRVEFRSSLAELVDRTPNDSTSDLLLAFGGASFNSEPTALDAEDPTPAKAVVAAATPTSSRPHDAASSRLHGTTWARGFDPLPFTAQEAHALAALHEEVFEGRGRASILEKRKASRDAFETLAPHARWLHLATHGWYATDSIRAWDDPEPIDKLSGLVERSTGEEQVKRMSPMLLCGLAFAGANLAEDPAGRAPGLITAEEISTLDLSGCELAVLSACDTNVGVRRSGQGVASLQRALQMAGARSVITSLWKVPDEATKTLMLEFYRRLWVEGEPKARALLGAKQKLRQARDEDGRPRYTTRDWAAWILTGEPD